MKKGAHIPYLTTISALYEKLQIGIPQGDDFAIMRIEDQPATKQMEMPLFRCNFYRLVFFRNTGVEFNLPDAHFNASGNSIYFAYPGKLESWLTHNKVCGYVVSFTGDFAQMDALHSSFEQTFPFFEFNSQSLLKFSEEEAKPLRTTLERMITEMETKHTDYKQMVRHILHQYLIQVRRLYYQQQAKQSDDNKNDLAIFARFRREVDQCFYGMENGLIKNTPSVSLIANRLHLNASYLNTLIKNLTGKTASSYIHEKTILEAKSYLVHTNFQAIEIAYKLGFSSASYFNRFFKQHTGETPSRYKKKQHYY